MFDVRYHFEIQHLALSFIIKLYHFEIQHLVWMWKLKKGKWKLKLRHDNGSGSIGLVVIESSHVSWVIMGARFL